MIENIAGMLPYAVGIVYGPCDSEFHKRRCWGHVRRQPLTGYPCLRNFDVFGFALDADKFNSLQRSTMPNTNSITTEATSPETNFLFIAIRQVQLSSTVQMKPSEHATLKKALCLWRAAVAASEQ